ncbi:hypothetical protein VTK73DRAFT_10168 [Phialemonium thermophilum]|uniref:Uncharacterized protein n=1 Tax=Phialemonium thermophilum TaxID=223376 RepID=A0ABR3VY46_9PEZI
MNGCVAWRGRLDRLLASSSHVTVSSGGKARGWQVTGLPPARFGQDGKGRPSNPPSREAKRCLVAAAGFWVAMPYMSRPPGYKRSDGAVAQRGETRERWLCRVYGDGNRAQPGRHHGVGLSSHPRRGRLHGGCHNSYERGAGGGSQEPRHGTPVLIENGLWSRTTTTASCWPLWDETTEGGGVTRQLPAAPDRAIVCGSITAHRALPSGIRTLPDGKNGVAWSAAAVCIGDRAADGRSLYAIEPRSEHQGEGAGGNRATRGAPCPGGQPRRAIKRNRTTPLGRRRSHRRAMMHSMPPNRRSGDAHPPRPHQEPQETQPQAQGDAHRTMHRRSCPFVPLRTEREWAASGWWTLLPHQSQIQNGR